MTLQALQETLKGPLKISQQTSLKNKQLHELHEITKMQYRYATANVKYVRT